MKKIISLSIALIILVAMLAACSPVISTASIIQIQSTSDETLEDTLGVGILKLEGTTLALTTEQAVTLLPLWKAVNSLGTDSSTADAEMQALYSQIEENLSADQIKAIQEMTWSQEELASFIQQYSAQISNSDNGSSQSAGQSAGGPSDMAGGMPSSDITAVSGTNDIQMTTGSTTTTAASLGNAQGVNIQIAAGIVSLLQQKLAA